MSQHRSPRLVAAIVVGLLGALVLPGSSLSSEAGATASVVPKSGFYQGRTGQGQSISLTVRNHKYVTRARFTIRNNCGGRTTVTLTPAGRGIPISSAGRFRYDSSTTDLSGTFVSARRVRGAVSNSSTIYGPFGSQTCRGGTTYTAHH
jgi:hypothetical protein